MKVLFLSSHSDHEAPLNYLLRRDDIDLLVKVTGELDPYPDKYDVGISFLYNFRIPSSQLLPSRTWVNYHPAPLPQYRGRNVAYHAILNGEKEFGATMHYIDQTFDTGAIIDRHYFPVLECDTAGDIAKQARVCCAILFFKHINTLLMGMKLEAKPQILGTYYKKKEICPYIELTPEQQMKVRAITADPHFAKTTIGGVEYVIRPAN